MVSQGFIYTNKILVEPLELVWCSGSVMDCHATPGGVKTELHILRMGQLMRVPSLNDLAVDGT